MHYRELAANQRGFLLRSQLTEEEIKEARETGFIIENPPSRLDYLFYTKLNISDWSEMFYKWWLVAFPTIPPEQRNPMPYLAGSEALQIRGIGRIGSGDPTCIITPPELMPYANIEEKVTDEFIVDDNIQPTDWSLVDGVPVENILPALRKYLMTNDDFEYSADATLDAYDEGCSWDELAEVLEVCTKRWTDENGRKPQTGNEVLNHFLNEYASPATSEEEDDDYDEDDDW